MNNINMSDYLQLYLHPISMARDIKMAIILKISNNKKEDKVKPEIIEFTYNNKQIKMLNLSKRIIRLDYAIKEIFIDEIYKQLDVKDKAVLDFGSSIGDSSIYFIINGAKTVICYDLDKQYTEIATKNAEINNISGIKTFNKPASSNAIESFCDEFKDIKKAMKLDCEGGEYETLLNSNKLAEFDEILIEYHYGYINLLKKLKEAGFKTEHTRPKVGGSGWHMQIGYIYAKK